MTTAWEESHLGYDEMCDFFFPSKRVIGAGRFKEDLKGLKESENSIEIK